MIGLVARPDAKVRRHFRWSLLLVIPLALSACGVKSQLVKPGAPAKQQTEEPDPSMPPQPLGK